MSAVAVQPPTGELADDESGVAAIASNAQRADVAAFVLTIGLLARRTI
jgi:hypothetical protein